MLQVKEPWDREIDATRNRYVKTCCSFPYLGHFVPAYSIVRNCRIRSCYKLVHFSHPTSSGAQSIDHLWIYTTHVIISRYRALIANLDKQLLQQESGTLDNGHRRNQGGQPTGPVEIRKVLTRFRSFLCSEQTFYRAVITSFVETFGLARVGHHSDRLGEPGQGHGDQRGPTNGPDQIDIDVQAYLEVVGIPIISRQEEPNPTETPIQKISLRYDEALKKVGLVHKALVCLGDLERYKEQYGSERDKQFGQSGRQGRRRDPAGGINTVKTTGLGSQEEPEESYAKAKGYYEVARGLLPDTGTSPDRAPRLTC
jgi:hypothetical protein